MSVRELLRANDRRFLEQACALSAREWAAPSLCDRWSNHEVLAHLVGGYGGGLGELVGEMCCRRGSFDAANTALAQRLAATRTPAQLLDELAVLVARPTGMGRYLPRTLFLGDHVTHELDIWYSLDRTAAVTPDALVAVLNAQVTLPNPFVPAFRNSRGLRLVATDVGWTHGRSGPRVAGRAADVVSVLASRPRRLDALTGDGVAVLAERLRRASRPSRTGA